MAERSKVPEVSLPQDLIDMSSFELTDCFEILSSPEAKRSFQAQVEDSQSSTLEDVEERWSVEAPINPSLDLKEKLIKNIPFCSRIVVNRRKSEKMPLIEAANCLPESELFSFKVKRSLSEKLEEECAELRSEEQFLLQ